MKYRLLILKEIKPTQTLGISAQEASALMAKIADECSSYGGVTDAALANLNELSGIRARGSFLG